MAVIKSHILRKEGGMHNGKEGRRGEGERGRGKGEEWRIGGARGRGKEGSMEGREMNIRPVTRIFGGGLHFGTQVVK